MTDVGTAVEQAIEESASGATSQPNSLASIADAAFDKAVAAEEAEKGTVDDPTEDPKGAPAPTVTDDDKDEPAGEKDPAKPAGDTEEDDEGYYADEGTDEVEKADLANPAGTPTDMGTWVLEQLPNIYVIGTNKAGEQISMSVKRAEDLPNDFEFLSKRDELIFNQNIADQTGRAVGLINKWNSDQQQTSASKFSEQENRDIQLDIADLQREGLIGRFKYQPSDTRFENDPAVKSMQEVLDYYNEQNQKRYAESQRTGRLFSRLSYRDAFYLYQRQNPASDKGTEKQKQEDTARKAATKVLAKGAKGQGDAAATPRPRLSKNASVDEIIAAYGLD